ncbi:MAG: AAA family ATPase [Bacteroidetes bacterium]|nr:AAA family ATPase [Bacteroidota bacterium]MBK9671856.1 AAA family ATPase [Bacteroidota bacterium]MBK9798571.1 AAA family ATPase [Bacteroidota bacterium]MBP6414729.1 AAA family ATPase [Bacteroidia bacterium]
MQFKSESEAVDFFVGKYKELNNEIGKVIIGQNEVIRDVLISIFSRGHCLLVGVPGLAKTLLVNTIAETLGLQFSRIQFTPDLMPSDIIGSEILDESRNFRFIKGPLFANIVLADEINRTPPKTQSSLLEAMQERAVTAAGKRYELGNPFFVLATQNPIEQEGTYPLPEAQLDRFMFNVWLDYPTYSEELQVVKNTTSDKKVTLSKVMDDKQIVFFQDLVRRIPVAENVMEYAVKLAIKSRPNSELAPEIVKKYVTWGAGPRASQFLIVGAKCHAMLQGKYSPDMEDVKAVSTAILRHRIVRNYKAEADGVSVDSIIQELTR